MTANMSDSPLQASCYYMHMVCVNQTHTFPGAGSSTNVEPVFFLHALVVENVLTGFNRTRDVNSRQESGRCPGSSIKHLMLSAFFLFHI